ncbi:MAG TPA: transglutaminaseTgpA domain-containing protein [Thermoleophilaceae bacterium]|nr:transglutaminaseTgpA domain-containing protein [Thermoleophilaceae bacterium]
MSAATAPPPSAPPAAPAAPPAPVEPTRRPDALGIRVAVFAALLAFAAGHWVTFVSGPPALRLAALVAWLTSGGLALAWLGRAPMGRQARTVACAGVSLLTLAGGMVITGLAARLLWPGNWDDLAELLDRGLSAIHTVAWPYSGGDGAVRLVVLLGAPLLGGVAAVLAFWPARRQGGLLRALALVSLLVLYGTAATEHDLGRPLLRGITLFLLVAAWLWLPRLPPPETVAGAATVLVVGFLSLPLSAGLDADSPWWDYRSWSWFGSEADVAFDWNHSYGPMNWPRDGKTLLNVDTRKPTYLKAETLDRFDGRRWVRSAAGGDGRPGGELPMLTPNRWERSLRVTVRALRSDFVVSTGTPLSVNGADPVTPSADGTIDKLGEPLEKGESYSVRAYVPEPRPAEMRAAEPGREGPGSSYFSVAARYTGVTLPATAAPGPGASRPVFVPPRGLPGGAGSRGAERELSESPYRRTYRLARRLTASAPTVFSGVRAVERYLERNMRYDEGPPARRFPLEAFLFRDKRGYCQHFSGAMALMLRMSGIPARVVSGFSPGVRDAEKRDEYRIRDLDAHSWVEVYFAGIGWVTFDPTPPVAPAQSQVAGFDLGGERDAGSASGAGGRAPRADRSGDPAAPAGGGEGGSGLASLLIGLAALALGAGGLLVGRRLRAAGSLEGGDAAEARARELARALPRLGVSLGPGATLTTVEHRLRAAAKPAAARYAERLRATRFGASGGDLPSAAARRALRRELGGRALRRRLLALRLIPPGGPRI